MTQSAYPSNELEPLRNLAAAADAQLQGQLTAAVAADQRAMVFAGFLAAAAAALGSAAATVLTGNTIDRFVGGLAIFAAGGMLAAMVIAMIAARPVVWFFPGSYPADWQIDFSTNKPEIERYQELLADYDSRIYKNGRRMLWNGRLISASAIVAVAILFISGLMLVGHVWN